MADLLQDAITRSHKAQLIPPQDIERGEEMRTYDEKAMISIRDSIQQIGQQNPIAVLARETADMTTEYHLVAGRHRLEACRELGRHVLAVVFRDEAEAKFWAVSENLHRVDLTAEDRALLMSKWYDLWRAKKDREVSPHDSEKRVGRPEGGFTKAAREIGTSADTLKRAVDYGNLPEEIRTEAKDAGMTLVETAKLADVPPDEQKSKIAERTVQRGLAGVKAVVKAHAGDKKAQKEENARRIKWLETARAAYDEGYRVARFFNEAGKEFVNGVSPHDAKKYVIIPAERKEAALAALSKPFAGATMAPAPAIRGTA